MPSPLVHETASAAPSLEPLLLAHLRRGGGRRVHGDDARVRPLQAGEVVDAERADEQRTGEPCAYWTVGSRVSASPRDLPLDPTANGESPTTVALSGCRCRGAHLGRCS